MERSRRTSASSTPIPIALAAPARCFSTFSKEAGAGAFRTSNTAAASASLTSAIRPLGGVLGQVGCPRATRSAPRASRCPSTSAPVCALGPAARRRPRRCPRRRGPRRGSSASATPCRAFPGDELAAALEPQPPVEVVWVGEQRQRGAALLTDRPLRWNSHSIPSRSCLVYIPGSFPDPQVRLFVRGPVNARYVALPRFPRRNHEMCGTATVFVQHARDVWHCHVSRARTLGLRARREPGPPLRAFRTCHANRAGTPRWCA